MNLRRIIIVCLILFSAVAFFVLPEKFNPMFLLLFVPILGMGIKYWNKDFTINPKNEKPN